MNNAELFCNWLQQRQLNIPGLQLTTNHSFFEWRQQLCVLPYLRVYWKSDSGEPPEWETESWCEFGPGWTRFLRADQGLDWLVSIRDRRDNPASFEDLIQRALNSGWLVPVEELWANCETIMSRRVQAVRVDLKGRRFLWRRQAKLFPDSMRQAIEGLDPVHTPENENAGLVRYLCEGWSISPSGKLEPGPLAGKWGPSTVNIPYRLFDAPRRLMLGASLQMCAVALTGREGSENESGAPGCYLRAAFSCFNGWTHEDAFVLSASAARKLTRHEVRRISVSIPAVASRIEILAQSGSKVQRGEKLVRTFIDLYGLGFRRHEAADLGADDGWLEIGLINNEAAVEGSITEIKRTPVDWAKNGSEVKWRETITFTLERESAVQVGDKLSTRHGLKELLAG